MTMRLELPLERIGREAKEVDAKKLFLTLLVFLPMALGWIARKVWLFIAWTAIATRVGWDLAGKSGDSS